MDQDNTKGQDKRNWRERLGIGAQGNKDLPKISDDFRKESSASPARPVAVGAARPAPRPAAPAVKPAPMAPRANPKAIHPAPVPADKLAERLRSQREASTKLAEQRVQVAKQRGEAQVAAPVAAPSPAAQNPAAPKPKFTFAEEAEQNRAAAQPAIKPQMPPPRAPLGAPAVPPPSVQNQPAARPAYLPQQQTPYMPQQPVGFPPAYNPQPVPPYRPIDPATGMPSTGYVPPRNFPPPPMQGGFNAGPRLAVPPRVPVQPQQGGYPPQQDFAPATRYARPEPRVAPPQQGEYEPEFYDEVPQAPTRGPRPTTTDYKQAYQEAEYGYEEEAPRSKAPWILAGLLLLALLVAGGGVWFYQNSLKPLMSGQSGQQDVPAVAAPETPAKVQPEQPAAAAQQPAAAAPTKKQIYDRIVGDQEILGGEVSPPAEQPAAIPEPATPAAGTETAPANSGEDAAPLPIPPPPGGTGDQQGSLAPDNAKQSSEISTAAAGESQAAVAAQDLPLPPKPAEPASAAAVEPVAAAAPPTPGEDKARSILSETKVADPVSATAETETIADPEPVVAKKKAEAPAKKPAPKTAEKKLGSKPVVLVPPSKKAKAAAAPQDVAQEPVANASGEAGAGLYGNEDVTVGSPQAQPVAPATAPKKKKTLADLFNSNEDNVGGTAVEPEAAPAPPPKKVAAIEQPPVAPKPAPQAPAAAAAGGGGFVVQLASFRSREEAAREYSRLKAKHAGALGPYAPIISEAEVGGSTRYRLSAGRMTSQAQANAVCSSLFAKGERDCLVKKQ